MDDTKLSRRDALRTLSAAMSAALAASWPEIARASHDAHAAAQSPATATLQLLGAADAADVEALTSQIIPSDDTPGAREAGVTYFIDRALGSFFAHWRPTFMQGLNGFQAAVRRPLPRIAPRRAPRGRRARWRASRMRRRP